MPEYRYTEDRHQLTKVGYETIVRRRSDGTVLYQGWYLNGELHKDDGPAHIRYNEDGSIYSQSWRLHGKNLGGPTPLMIARKKLREMQNYP